HAPLVATGLVTVEDAERSWLTRTVGVPDRVCAHLLGDDVPDATVAAVVDADVAGGVDLPEEASAPLGRLLASGVRLAYLRQRGGGSATEIAVAALAAAGRGALGVDAERLLREPDPMAVVKLVRREALLRGAGIVVGPVDA